MGRTLVVIARDRPELWVTWAAFYGGAETVEGLLDRRQGQPWRGRGHHLNRRAQSRRETDLHDHGFIVTCRPGTVRSSR